MNAENGLATPRNAIDPAEAARERARRAYVRKRERMATDPEYREMVLAKQREYSRVRYERHPEAVRESNRKYREANRTARNEYSRQWREDNPERARELDRDWRRRNLDTKRKQRRDYMRARRREAPDLVRDALRKWQSDNPCAVREYRLRRKAREAGHNPTPEDRRLVREWCEIVSRDPCSYAREPRPSEHVDHIVPLVSGGIHAWDNLTGASAKQNHQKHTRSLLFHMLDQLEEAQS